MFGPVADPAGTWGLAVIETDTEEKARTHGANDPALLADMGFRFEVYPMPRVTLRTSARLGR